MPDRALPPRDATLPCHRMTALCLSVTARNSTLPMRHVAARFVAFASQNIARARQYHAFAHSSAASSPPASAECWFTCWMNPVRGTCVSPQIGQVVTSAFAGFAGFALGAVAPSPAAAFGGSFAGLATFPGAAALGGAAGFGTPTVT